MKRHTVFGDLRRDAVAVFRVTTQASVYIVGFHESRGRRFAVVRGQPGTDREHVVVRDSDPRVGEHSMFELPPDQWIGQVLEVATMTSSTITAVAAESDPRAIALVGGHAGDPSSGDPSSADANPWARPPVTPDPPPRWSVPAPPGLSDNPRIQVGLSRGTNPAAAADTSSSHLARQVVVGHGQPAAAETPEPELPYPSRHVRYAENAAALMRSIARRDRLFEDIAGDRALRARLRRALDDLAALLETIRRRDRA